MEVNDEDREFLDVDFHMPPGCRYRKNSTDNLQSRLKSRRLLGVGENSTGEIYKSKLSQLLGQNEFLYVDLPNGLWQWLNVSTLLFLSYALWALFVPGRFLGLSTEQLADMILPIRIDGAACLSLTLTSWGVKSCYNREVLRLFLLSTNLYLAIVSLAWSWHNVQAGLWSTLWTVLIIARIGMMAANGVYWLLAAQPQSVYLAGNRRHGGEQSRDISPTVNSAAVSDEKKGN